MKNEILNVFKEYDREQEQQRKNQVNQKYYLEKLRFLFHAFCRG